LGFTNKPVPESTLDFLADFAYFVLRHRPRGKRDRFRLQKQEKRAMSEGFYVVIGMSIAYVASFLGLIFAYIHYKRRVTSRKKTTEEGT